MVQGLQKHHIEKQDIVLEKVSSFQDYLQKNKKYIFLSIVVVFLVVVFALYWYKNNTNNEERMSASVGIAVNDFTEKDYKKVIERLSKSTEQYISTDAAELGMFYLATSYYHSNNFEEAEKLYSEFITRNNNPLLKSSAYAGIAACAEAEGDTLKAKQSYKKAADASKMKHVKHDNLIRLAVLLVKSGDEDGALEILNNIREDAANTKQSNIVDFLISSLN